MPTPNNRNPKLPEDQQVTATVEKIDDAEPKKVSKEELLDQFKSQIDALHRAIADKDRVIANQSQYIDSLLAERTELAAAVSRANSAIRLLASNAELSSDSVVDAVKNEYNQFHSSLLRERQRNESRR